MGYKQILRSILIAKRCSFDPEPPAQSPLLDTLYIYRNAQQRLVAEFSGYKTFVTSWQAQYLIDKSNGGKPSLWEKRDVR